MDMVQVMRNKDATFLSLFSHYLQSGFMDY